MDWDSVVTAVVVILLPHSLNAYYYKWECSALWRRESGQDGWQKSLLMPLLIASTFPLASLPLQDDVLSLWVFLPLAYGLLVFVGLHLWLDSTTYPDMRKRTYFKFRNKTVLRSSRAQVTVFSGVSVLALSALIQVLATLSSVRG